MSSVILAQGGDTWGISGPTFLVGYLIVGVTLYLAALRARRAMSAVDSGTRGRLGREFTARFVPRASSAATEADPSAHAAADAEALSGPAPASGASAAAAADPYLIALLNGGPKLAVLAGQSALRAHGLLGEGHRVPEAAARPIPAAHPKWPLELAILSATDLPVPYSQLRSDPAVLGALRALSDELVQHRLLVSEQRRDRLRLWGLALFGLFALGVWRLVDGIGHGHPVGFLVPLMLLAGAGTALWYLRLPRRTPSGDAALARLRREYAYLVPSLYADRAASGPAAAALGVAVFGIAAIWAADPAFAAQLDIASAAASAHAVLASDSSGSAGRTYWGGSSDSR